MLKNCQYRFIKSQQFIEKAETIRKTHPEMGCRKMALKLKERGFGRDKLEDLLLHGGFRILYPPNYTKTTHSVRVNRFGNLIEGLVVTGINQVVQTDITYFWMNRQFAYMVFIIDVYSRLIVGYHAGLNLEAKANLKALDMMIKLRGEQNLNGLIHHSDKGSQYHCIEYLQKLKLCNIQISMCDVAWQNAYTERINRTIKHEYLRHRKIDSIEKLKVNLDRDIKAYNTDRPHWSLINQMAPATFEQYLTKFDESTRPQMRIYKHVEQRENEFFLAMQQSDNKIAAKK
jgi:transposase InsO family protein